MSANPEYRRAYYARTQEEARAASSKWSAENAERKQEVAAQRRARTKAWLDDLKGSTPCADCQVCYPPYVMDFDHVRGEKVSNIAKVARSWSIDRLLEEIAKCDLVCSNCHRIRTFTRGQN